MNNYVIWTKDRQFVSLQMKDNNFCREGELIPLLIVPLNHLLFLLMWCWTSLLGYTLTRPSTLLKLGFLFISAIRFLLIGKPSFNSLQNLIYVSHIYYIQVKYFPLQKPTGIDQCQDDVKIIVGGTRYTNIMLTITTNEPV